VTEENWPASVGIFTGVLAKEAVVGTLDALYTTLGEEDEAKLLSQTNPKPLSWRADKTAEEFDGTAADGGEPAFDLLGTLGEGLATIPVNLGDAVASWLDPLGLNIGNVTDYATAAEAQGVQVGTFGAMQDRFGSHAAAFAYLLFVLLYVPCIAAVAAIRRETTLRWTLFVAGWTTGLAYAVATVFYQAATFVHHPASSAAWIAGMLAAFLASVALMRHVGRREGAPAQIAGAQRA